MLFELESESWNNCVAYIDGGSRGNPGTAGYGVHVTDERGRTLASLSEPLGVKTNNAAEYLALIAALEFAASKRCQKLKVLADSQLLVRQINGTYRVKNTELAALFNQAKCLIASFKSFSIEHIPREKNQEADRLANLAMDRTSDFKSSRAETKPPIQLSAVFRGGCFRPLETVDLPENSKVYLNIVRVE
jgi:probable phosphoglycerate mutase